MIADALRQNYDVHVELLLHATIVLVIALATAANLLRVAGDVEEVVSGCTGRATHR